MSFCWNNGVRSVKVGVASSVHVKEAIEYKESVCACTPVPFRLALRISESAMFASMRHIFRIIFSDHS